MDTEDFTTPSKSVPEWCAFRGYSEATFYKLKRAGLAPAVLTIPGFNIPRITARADQEWQERMAALAQEKAAQLERERRADHARRAGKAAAQSPDHVSKRRRAIRERGERP
jgi:hypothetical protein